MSRIADKVTQLCAWGTSRAVRIPKDMCERMGIDVGARLTMSLGHDERGSFMLVRPEEAEHRAYRDIPYVSMDELFAGYTGDYQPGECDWGKDLGTEVIP